MKVKKRREMTALERERKVVQEKEVSQEKEVDHRKDLGPRIIKSEEVDQRAGKRKEEIVKTSSRTLNMTKREKKRKRDVSQGRYPFLDTPVTSPTEKQPELDRKECTGAAMTDEGEEGMTGKEMITIEGEVTGTATEVGTEETAGRGTLVEEKVERGSALEETAERGEEIVGIGLLKSDAGSAVPRREGEVLKRGAARGPQRRETCAPQAAEESRKRKLRPALAPIVIVRRSGNLQVKSGFLLLI